MRLLLTSIFYGDIICSMRIARHWISAFIFGSIGIFMLNLSWKKWPDALVDFGRELYVPWQINQGKLLYRDLTHFYGPFSDYLNSWLFKIFGTSIMTLALFNIGLIIILTYLIYQIFLTVADWVTATLAGASFLSLFAFSQYVLTGNYNFVCPYSYEVTHGVFLTFFAIYMFIKYLNRQRSVWLVIIGICLGLVFLSKVEIFLAAMIAFCIGFFLLTTINRITFREALKLLSVLSLSFMLPIACFVIFFSRYVGTSKAIDYLLLQYQVILHSSMPSNIFYMNVSGMSDPILNFGKMINISAWYLFLLAVTGLLAYGIKHLHDKKVKNFMILLIFGVLIILMSPNIGANIPWYNMLRPLPLIMILLLFYFSMALFRFHKDRQMINKILPLCVLAIFAFFLLIKIILNVHVFHYGFALAMPATLLFIMAVVYYIPIGLGRLFSVTSFVRGLAVVAICMTLLAHIGITKHLYDQKTYCISSGGDAIYAWSPNISTRELAIDLTLKKILEISKPGETMVVFPDIVLLNYLSRKENPCPYFEFSPPGVEIIGEDRVIGSLKKYLPDYIVLTNRNTSEHGYPCFGTGYAVRTYSWIKENYIPIFQIYPPSLGRDEFRVIITKYKKDRSQK